MCLAPDYVGNNTCVSFPALDGAVGSTRNVSADLENIQLAQNRLLADLQYAAVYARGMNASTVDGVDAIEAEISQVINASSRLYIAIANFFSDSLKADDSGHMSQHLLNEGNDTMDSIVRVTSETTTSVCELASAFETKDYFRRVSTASSLSWSCGVDFGDVNEHATSQRQALSPWLMQPSAHAGPPSTAVLSPSLLGDGSVDGDVADIRVDVARSTNVQAPLSMIVSTAETNSLVEQVLLAASSWRRNASQLATLRSQLLRQPIAHVHITALVHSASMQRRLLSEVERGQSISRAPPPASSTILLLPFDSNDGTDPRNVKGFGSSALGEWRPLLLHSISWLQTGNRGYFTGAVCADCAHA